jgi:hypothetical protein
VACLADERLNNRPDCFLNPWRYSALGELEDELDLLVNVGQKVFLLSFDKGKLHQLFEGLGSDLVRVELDQV